MWGLQPKNQRSSTTSNRLEKSRKFGWDRFRRLRAPNQKKPASFWKKYDSFSRNNENFINGGYLLAWSGFPSLREPISFDFEQFSDSCDSMNAYLQFSTDSEVQEALKLNGSLLNDHHIRVNQAHGHHVHFSLFWLDFSQNDFKSTVFVGNLHFKCTEEEVLSFFEECGPIEYVRIIRDPKTYIGKGFCYVAFKDKVGAQNAFRMNGQEFKGREIRVKKAVENPQKSFGQRQDSKRGAGGSGFHDQGKRFGRSQERQSFGFKRSQNEEEDKKAKKPRKEGGRSFRRALEHKEKAKTSEGEGMIGQKRQKKLESKGDSSKREAGKQNGGNPQKNNEKKAPIPSKKVKT